MLLDKQQEAVVKAKENKIVVIAASGAGKTTTLTERIRYISQFVDPQDIVAITFTNMAAEEMRERLSGDANGAFIGTIHSYANKLLSRAGYDTSTALKNDKFDDLFNMIMEHPQVIEKVKYLLVDEFQDVARCQFDFFMKINPDNFFVVGDDYQNIYSWRDADVSLFKSLVDDPSYAVYKLENNYRSGSRIISFAKRQLGNQELIFKNVYCKRKITGYVSETDATYIEVCDFLRGRADYKDWFILCRSNKEVDDTMYYLSKAGIPATTFKKSELTRAEMQRMLNEDNVKVLTIHSAKGLEATNVIVWNFYCKDDEDRRVAYVAATRAKDNLIWCKRKPIPKKRKEVHQW